MEIVAKLKKVNEVVERGSFKSRPVWVETEFDGKYPQTVEIELHQDKVDLFASVGVGSEVKLYLNLRGREWTNPEGITRVFNSLVCWKMEVLNAAGGSVEKAASVEEHDGRAGVDDLPF